MKSFYRITFVVFLILLLGACQQQQKTFTDADQEVIKKEVKDHFNQLVLTISQKNADEWSGHYSKDGFLSAIAGTDYYASRSAWVELITKCFSTRERQHLEPLEVRVTALAPDVALMTSEEKSEMRIKNGKDIKSKHVYTMIWKKESGGWKILHSHESWTEEKIN